MTSTEQSAASRLESSADYQKTIPVKANAGALFDALTSLSGLAAWWANVTGCGDTGGELKFFMSFPEPLVIHVDRATRPTSVQWSVTDCPFLPDWVGTCPTFTITEIDSGVSELHFRHHGLTPQLECFNVCEPSWNHFLSSFRDYVEIGRGMPFGSAEDKSRRLRDGANSD